MVVVGAGEPSPRALTASESELVLRRLLRIVAEVAQECKRREASSSAAEAQSEADHKTVSLSNVPQQHSRACSSSDCKMALTRAVCYCAAGRQNAV